MFAALPIWSKSETDGHRNTNLVYHVKIRTPIRAPRLERLVSEDIERAAECEMALNVEVVLEMILPPKAESRNDRYLRAP